MSRIIDVNLDVTLGRDGRLRHLRVRPDVA